MASRRCRPQGLSAASPRDTHVPRAGAGPESAVEFSRLPGGDPVAKGLRDLARPSETVEALLVSIAAPRLHDLGIVVTAPLPDPEHRLYERLAREEPDSAHSRYNALLRRLTSFESALECVG
jgi:hypothetical protein